MTRALRITVVSALLVLGLAGPAAADADTASGDGTWLQAVDPWPWSFPGDHGSHPGFRTEWWYFTGNLMTGDGRELGYQLTFFRTGLRSEAAPPENPWSVRDLFLAHLAVTDASRERFHWTERVSRAGPGLAGAAEGRLDVWLRDWRVVWSGGVIDLKARSEGTALALTLTPRKDPVLHGRKGLSRKGPDPGQASHYATITDLATGGTITLPGGETVSVNGRSWFDHEFGSNQLAAGQQGWDWFGLHLSDGTELMVYLIRRKDGSLEPASSGTLVAADGSWRHLPLEAIKVRAIDTWQSPQTGGRYPSGWTVRVPSMALDIAVTPLVRDQELATEATAGITYWEGAVRLTGTAGNRRVTGGGYVELTGYAGSLGGVF